MKYEEVMTKPMKKDTPIDVITEAEIQSDEDSLFQDQNLNGKT